MRLKFLSRPAIVVAASALGLVLSLPAEAGPRAGSGARPAAAQPRAQHSHGVPRGNYERETVRTRTETGHTRNPTVTNGQGQTATRDISVARDPATGTLTRSMDSTGFGGQSRSADTVITRAGAADRVEVQGGAVVQGDVTTKRLIVQEGGEINGLVRMSDLASSP